jgi:hypothetical protein
MTPPNQLRRQVRRARRITGDAYIDVAYHAKVHPTTVGKFLRGDTSCPTFLTRWGLELYASRHLNQSQEQHHHSNGQA